MTLSQSAQKKCAFVSGGSKGIGLAVVQALVRSGYFVVTCGRHQDTWRASADADTLLQAAVDFQECDLSRADLIGDLFSYIGKKYGTIAVAVNSASPAIASVGRFEQVDTDALLSTLMSDFWVPALCMRHELNLMSAGGAIVNVSSINGIRPTPGTAMYSAAKHGLEGLTRSVALEALERGVRVNSVAPGATWTPRWEKRVAEGQVSRVQVEELIPLKRFASAEEIASAVMWLASDESRYVVGHTLVVDGGLSLK